MITEDEAYEYLESGPDQLLEVEQALLELRRSWPHEPEARIAARVADLNRDWPQARPLGFKLIGSSAGSSCEWIDPRAIVRTADPEWGTFTGRRPENFDMIVRSLLVTPTAKLRRTLIHDFFAGHDIIHVCRLAGFGGPLYELGYGGSHRTHVIRALGLPWVFCEVAEVEFPLRMELRALMLDDRQEAEQVVLWKALTKCGFITADTAELDLLGRMTVTHAPAPWLMNLPAQACALSVLYERLYPGFMARLGIPNSALLDPALWRKWLTARL